MLIVSFVVLRFLFCVLLLIYFTLVVLNGGLLDCLLELFICMVIYVLFVVCFVVVLYVVFASLVLCYLDVCGAVCLLVGDIGLL